MAGFGAALSRCRRTAGLSQAELAARAGLSQRHISFLETGRARPGRRALDGLVDALSLDAPGAAALLAAAGLGPQPRPADWEGPGMARIRAMCSRLLARHDPWPAYVLTPGGRLLLGNSGLTRLLDRVGGANTLLMRTAPAEGPNIFDLTLRPDGLAPYLAAPERSVPHILHRLRLAAALDPEAARTLDRVLRTPLGQRFARFSAAAVEDPLVEETYAVGGRTYRFAAVLTRFGSASDALVAGLNIECLVPADPATERHLADDASPGPPAG
jgi:transcriptional regulator with XRE-family HTH domain